MYELDSDRSTITGLTPKPMSITFSSTTRMTVSTRIPIQLDLTLADTTTQSDTIRVFFPPTSTFLYSDIKSSTSGFLINSTSTTYDTTNKVLEIRQRSQSQVNYANKAISIQMSWFVVPATVRGFQVGVQVLRQGFRMTEGMVAGAGVVNGYSGSVKVGEAGVSRVTGYEVTVEVKDTHMGNMMVEIVLPSTVTITPLTFSCRTSLSPTTTTPTVSLSSTSPSTITLTNLLSTPSSLTTIPPQTLTITLFNITNPSSVKSIGNFTIRTYYTNDYVDKVSESVIASGLSTTSGSIMESSVHLVMGSMVNY